MSADDRTGFLQGEARFRFVTGLAMVVLVVAAALGFLGPRDATASVQGGAGHLELQHPHLTRPGLETEVTVTVTPDDSVDVVRLRVDSELLRTLRLETVHPSPLHERAGNGVVEYEFAAVGGGPYAVTLSGRVPTKAVPTRLVWEIAWLSPDSSEALDVSATTWVLP